MRFEGCLLDDGAFVKDGDAVAGEADGDVRVRLEVDDDDVGLVEADRAVRRKVVSLRKDIVKSFLRVIFTI